MYQIALSFAGEDRNYVGEVARLLRQNGVSVFYDEFIQAELWGENLFEYLNDIYINKANYVIIFISHNYVRKVWTKHEWKASQVKILEENGFVLPARFDETELPGLNPTTGHIDLSQMRPESFVKIILDKLNIDLDEEIPCKVLLIFKKQFLRISDNKKSVSIYLNGQFLGVVEEGHEKEFTVSKGYNNLRMVYSGSYESGGDRMSSQIPYTDEKSIEINMKEGGMKKIEIELGKRWFLSRKRTIEIVQHD